MFHAISTTDSLLGLYSFSPLESFLQYTVSIHSGLQYNISGCSKNTIIWTIAAKVSWVIWSFMDPLETLNSQFLLLGDNALTNFDKTAIFFLKLVGKEFFTLLVALADDLGYNYCYWLLLMLMRHPDLSIL